jgi:DNA-directed RNA polymerase beta subunit
MTDIEDSNDLIAIFNSLLTEPKTLIKHHIDSINEFNSNGIEQIMSKGFKIQVEINNERDKTEEDLSISKYLINADIYNVELTPPETINYDTLKSQSLTPNEAHIKDLTYSSPMYINAKITATAYKKDGTTKVKEEIIERYKIAKIPIMVKSKLCNTFNKSKDTLIQLHEDPSDIGGYFIIKGNEWCIDNIESMTFNSPREFKNIGHKNELCRGDIISKPGDNFENSSIIYTKLLEKNLITFEITNNKFRDISIPFYVLFRAFGVCNDKEIIEHITYSLDITNITTKKMINILTQAFENKYPNMESANNIYNQNDILELIGKYINNYYNTSDNVRKYTINNVLTILDKDILPHVGLTMDDRYKKVRFLGHLIRRILLVHLDIIPSTDRDSYKNKRINPAGVSYAKIFKTQFNFAIVQQLRRQFIKEFKNNSFQYINLQHTFKTAISGHDFERALIQAIITGDKTISIKRKQVPNRLSSQQLHRKNQLNVISTLRNINTTNTSSAKQSSRANEMRRFHPSMVGYTCCVQSADTGEKVGMQKQMAISAHICLSSSSEILKDIIKEDKDLIILDKNLLNITIYENQLSKVFINGDWIGCCENMYNFATKYRNLRRQKKIHYLTTISTDILTNEVYFWVDIGRIARPLLIVYNNIEDEGYTHDKYKQSIKLTKEHIKKLNTGEMKFVDLIDQQIIEYITPEEHENCFIASDLDLFKENINNPLKHYTHVDIPQSVLGIPGLTSPFANHNQAARVVFQTNQVKQTCGWPCLNWPYKSYKEMYLQEYNETPLVQTIVNKYIPPIGSNAIIGIMIYGGYNQEDSIIMNQSSIDRGLFTTSHFSFEKTELDKNEEFKKPDPLDTLDIKAYSNYEKLSNGIVPVGTLIEYGDVIIGKISKLSKNDIIDNFKYTDHSVIYKGNEPAYVWDVIIGRNEEDNQFCKIVYRSIRKCTVGDKFSSRSGQKGTVGITYNDADMPCTSDGIKPDIIFNPHSLPTRMTMSIIFETMLSKICAEKGYLTDNTMFKSVDIDEIANELEKIGFNRNGTERMYNGMTGKYIDAEIFIGPIYYQKLQKFTIDTVYSHKTCPTDALTRQPLDGKSSSGGLKLGEMEVQALATNSINFLQEKFIDHSDKYDFYVCKKCNKKAVVNEIHNIYKCNYCNNNADIVKIHSTWSIKQFYDEIHSCNIGVKFIPSKNKYQQFLEFEE